MLRGGQNVKNEFLKYANFSVMRVMLENTYSRPFCFFGGRNGEPETFLQFYPSRKVRTWDDVL